jgi:hypothetical protein
MSRKSDTDNRSNQLNPNNDAYYSSRGLDDDDDYHTHETISYQRIAHDISLGLMSASTSRKFVLVYIGFSGRAKMIDLTLVQLRSFNRTGVSNTLRNYAEKFHADKLKEAERELGDRIAYTTLYTGPNDSISWQELARPANVKAAVDAQIKIGQFLPYRDDQDPFPALVVTTKARESFEGPDDIRVSTIMHDVMVKG